MVRRRVGDAEEWTRPNPPATNPEWRQSIPPSVRRPAPPHRAGSGPADRPQCSRRFRAPPATDVAARYRSRDPEPPGRAVSRPLPPAGLLRAGSRCAPAVDHRLQISDGPAGDEVFLAELHTELLL